VTKLAFPEDKPLKFDYILIEINKIQEALWIAFVFQI